MDEVALGSRWQAAKQVSDVGEWIKLVTDCTGDQRQDRGGGVAALFAADEEPVFATDGDSSQHTFGGVVVDSELAVVGVAAEGVPLVQRVADRQRDRALGQHLLLLLVEPGAELGQDWAGVLLAFIRNHGGAF